jgi:NADPH:quinone reductase-like Zn-dependent oxidoreductase
VTGFTAAYVAASDPEDPLHGLRVGPLEPPEVPAGWVRVRVRSSSLNHHDLWSLRGVGLPAERLPMILGTDAAGVDESGNEVVVYGVIDADSNCEAGEPLLSRRRSLLSELHPGTMATWVAVPEGNLVAKPASLPFEQAAALPTAWLTAYRMLVRGSLSSGNVVLVQGAGGGVATAAIVLAMSMGARVYATSRSEAKRQRVRELGAVALASGERLPERVDIAIETVGEATFDHSLRSVKNGGRVVVSGATSGNLPRVDLRQVFFRQVDILGVTMGTKDELIELLALVASGRVRPVIDSVFAFEQAPKAFKRLASGAAFGKIVLKHDG